MTFSAGENIQLGEQARDALLGARFDSTAQPFFAQVHARLREAFAAEGPRSGAVDHAVDTLMARRELTTAEAKAAFEDIIVGDLADDQIGALLMVLRPDMLPAATLAAFASVVQAKAKHVEMLGAAGGESLGDTCGTGSDTFGTFNVSTTIMFVLAADGIKIAKHGNRAVTSKCGSADVLSELGVKISLTPAGVSRCIREVGIGFMFAPAFHDAFSNVQRIRRILAQEMPREIQSRTVFNVLGPLSNPARAQWQILGVYDKSLVMKFGEALRLLKVKRALVPFGYGDGERGLDEFSTAGKTVYAELNDDSVEEKSIEPEDVGLARASTADLAGGDIKDNARILKEILSGKGAAPQIDLVLLNAGAGLYLGGKADSIREGVARARDVIRRGAALKKLEELCEASNSVE
ncbi:MAG TPA: anthranilate phosphoribosyltransferase [Polyangiaceae bacterium]